MTVPAGVVATDNIIIALCTATSTAGGHALTGTTGSGTLSVPSGGLNGQTISTSYKVTTLLGTGHVAGDVLTFSCPASGITTGAGGAWDNTVTFDVCGTAMTSAGTASQTVPAVTTSAANCIVVAVAVGAQTATRNFSSCTPSTDRFHLNGAGGGTRFTAISLSDQTVTSAGSSGTDNVTFSGTLTGSAGIQISLKPAGTNATITGVVAAATLAAPAGTVSATTSVTVGGAVSTVALAAPAGSVSATKNVTLSGVAAGASFAAPAGSVSTTASVALTGPTSGLALAAPAGAVGTATSATVAGPVSAFTLTAIAGAVSAGATVSGPTAGIAIAANAGSVTVAAAPRDINLAIQVGSDRWATTTSPDRWAARVGSDRWAVSVGNDRLSVQVGTDRFSTQV
jgi:hypothetical protein